MSPIAPISSPLMDLLKNTALSLMRLESILRISIEKTLRDRLIREIREQEMVSGVIAHGSNLQTGRI